MVILGLDPGTAATGYGIVVEEGSRLRALGHGVIRTRAGVDPALRLAAIHDAVRELALAHGPDVVAVEELFVGPNPRSALHVAHGRGAALAACGALAIPSAEYSVSQIKSAVCGFGRADKQQVLHMVRAILGLDAEPETEHAADALGAAICHAHHARTSRAVAAGGRR